MIRFYELNGNMIPDGVNVQVSFQNEPRSVYDVECSEEFKVLIDAGDVQGVLDRLETSSSNLEKLMHAASAVEYAAEKGFIGFLEPLVAIVKEHSGVDSESTRRVIRFEDGKFVTNEYHLSTWKLGEAFKKAAEKEHIESAEFLLDTGLIREFHIGEVFSMAAAHGRVEYMQKLLPVADDSIKGAALLSAAASNKTESLEFLLSLPNLISNYKDAALRNTALAEQISTLEFLLDRIKISDAVYANVLQSAANAGQMQVLKLLFALEGRNVDDREYSSIIQSAVWGGDHDTVEYLLARKVVSDEVYFQAIESAVSSAHQDIFQFLVEQHVLSDDDYSRVLQRVAGKGQIENLKFLLESRAITEEMKAVAWQAAVTSWAPGQGIECAELLAGEELDVQGQLIQALIMSDEFFIKKLLACGADIEVQHEAGQTIYERVDAGSIATPVARTFSPAIIDLFCKVKAINDDAALSEDVKKIVKAKVFTDYWFSETEFDALKAEAITKAGEFLESISSLDEATMSFVLENYIFVNDDLSSWLEAWKKGAAFDVQDMIKMGPKGLLVNLAVHCGDRIDSLDELFGKSKEAIMQFMHSVPRAEAAEEGVGGKVLPCSVVGQALRGLAQDPSKGLPGKQATWLKVMKLLTLDDIDFPEVGEKPWQKIVEFLSTFDDIDLSRAHAAQAAEELDPSAHLAGAAAEPDADVA